MHMCMCVAVASTVARAARAVEGWDRVGLVDEWSECVRFQTQQHVAKWLQGDASRLEKRGAGVESAAFDFKATQQHAHVT